jgi:hypothetical protein
VEGERGLEGLLRVTADEERVGGFGRAEWSCAQLLVLEDLGVANGDFGALLQASHPQSHPAHEVLAEVDERSTGRRLPDIDRWDEPRPSNRRAVRCDQSAEVRLDDLHRGLGTLRGVPRPPQVGDLPVVEVIGQDSALVRPPRIVRGQHESLAAGRGHLELRQHGQTIAVDRAPPVEGEVPAEPAVAEEDLEIVPPRPEQSGHVVHLRAEPVGVRRPAGGEHLVAHRHAVEHRHVDAVRRRIEAS